MSQIYALWALDFIFKPVLAGVALGILLSFGLSSMEDARMARRSVRRSSSQRRKRDGKASNRPVFIRKDEQVFFLVHPSVVAGVRG